MLLSSLKDSIMKQSWENGLVGLEHYATIIKDKEEEWTAGVIEILIACC